MEHDRKPGRGSRGVTMVEMLAAVGILALLAVILAVGLNTVIHSYHTMISRAERQLLLSTASNAVTEELRCASSVEPKDGGTVTSYSSARYGPDAVLSTKNADGTEETGRLVVTCGTKDYDLLPKERPETAAGGGKTYGGAYGKNGVYKVELTVLDYTAQVLTFKLTVKEDNYDGEASGTFAVRCLIGG